MLAEWPDVLDPSQMSRIDDMLFRIWIPYPLTSRLGAITEKISIWLLEEACKTIRIQAKMFRDTSYNVDSTEFRLQTPLYRRTNASLYLPHTFLKEKEDWNICRILDSYRTKSVHKHTVVDKIQLLGGMLLAL